MTILILVGIVLVTGGITFLFSERIKAQNRLFSTFSAALVATLLFVHILPDIYNSGLNVKFLGLALLSGLIIQLLLEKITHGLEHGHEHSHAKSHKSIIFGVMLGLCAHAFIEGMPISFDESNSIENEVVEDDHEHDHHNHHHNHHGHEHVDYSANESAVSDKFLSAILMHKIPVTLMLSLFLLSVRVKALFYFILIGVFAIMTPFGMLIGEELMRVPSINKYKFYFLALSSGMLLHIITSILFEHGHSKKETNLHILLIVAGITIGVILF